MTAKLEQTQSAWMQTEKIPSQSSLDMDTDADVCVVGAGIAGMTTAYLLLQEGKSVVVHGSRFDKDGHVFIGPANIDLAPVNEELGRDHLSNRITALVTP